MTSANIRLYIRPAVRSFYAFDRTDTEWLFFFYILVENDGIFHVLRGVRQS